MDPHKLQTNKESWDKLYTQFVGWCVLPAWGVYEACRDDRTLLGEVAGKTFLEICCGSGHSIKYLLENGAKKVYALDLSEKQLELSRKNNLEACNDGKVQLFNSPMEKPIPLPEKVDLAFSIYGMGWSLDPLATFKNIHSYLKPGGRFVWSWDHALFSHSKVQDGKVVVTRSYFDEDIREKSWKDASNSAYYSANRKISTWFKHLRDAGFIVNRYLEPYPFNINEDIAGISSPGMGEYYNPLKADKLPSVIIFECIKP